MNHFTLIISTTIALILIQAAHANNCRRSQGVCKSRSRGGCLEGVERELGSYNSACGKKFVCCGQIQQAYAPSLRHYAQQGQQSPPRPNYQEAYKQGSAYQNGNGLGAMNGQYVQPKKKKGWGWGKKSVRSVNRMKSARY